MLKKIFLVAVFLSLTLPRAGFYFRSLPITVANILFGIVCVVWLLKRIRQRKYPADPFEWIGFIYLCYIFLNSVSGVILGERLEAIIGFIILAGYSMLFFVTLNFLESEKDILLVSSLIILSMVVVIGYGLLQVFLDIEALSLPGLTELYGSPSKPVIIFKEGWFQVISGRAVIKNIMWGGGRKSILNPFAVGHKIFSTFHHGNLFGLHLATFIPFLFSLSLGLHSKKRIFFYFFIVVAMVVLIFTNSRGALFGLGAGIVCLMLLLPCRDWAGLFFIAVVSFLIFIFIISSAVLYNYRVTGVEPSIYLHYNFEPRYLVFCGNIISFWQAKFKKGYNEIGKLGSEINDQANQRFTYWRDVWKSTFRDRRLREILFGSFFRKTSYEKIHNFYFGIMRNNGLIGLGLFVLFIGYIVVTSFCSLNYISHEKFMAIIRGGLAGITAGLSHNLFDFPFYYPPLLANFWIVAGLIVASSRMGRFNNACKK